MLGLAFSSVVVCLQLPSSPAGTGGGILAPLKAGAGLALEWSKDYYAASLVEALVPDVSVAELKYCTRTASVVSGSNPGQQSNCLEWFVFLTAVVR